MAKIKHFCDYRLPLHYRLSIMIK